MCFMKIEKILICWHFIKLLNIILPILINKVFVEVIFVMIEQIIMKLKHFELLRVMNGGNKRPFLIEMSFFGFKLILIQFFPFTLEFVLTHFVPHFVYQ